MPQGKHQFHLYKLNATSLQVNNCCQNDSKKVPPKL